METSLRPGKSAQALALYDEVFEPLHAESLNIVEIGTQNAGSLLLLAKYFLKSNILGISQDKPSPELYADLNRSDVTQSVHLAVGNPTDRPLVDRVLDAHFGKADIDIIIDNASHRYDSTKATFEHLFPGRLRHGGHYVIESWGCGYWPMWVDGDPDGLHGLPLFVKELIDEIALADRTKVFKGKQAISSESIKNSSIQEIRVAPGTVVITRA